MGDRLASLLRHVDLRARVFHTGLLCTGETFDASAGVGYLHVLRCGRLEVDTSGAGRQQIEAPALLFYVRPQTHRLSPLSKGGVDLVCGSLDFGTSRDNPLTRTMPAVLVLPLQELRGLALTLELLFEEAFGTGCGRQVALDRLCELFIIQLLRHLIDSEQVDGGLLAGLGDPRLARALDVIHDDPATRWTLESLADAAGMSRARFAAHFHATVGMTPGQYLTSWRLGLAQSLLLRGKPVAVTAHTVGYSGAATLARAFQAQLGCSPRAWLNAQSEKEASIQHSG